jgi:hypothetical protein
MSIEAEFGDWMETIAVEPFEGDGAWSEGFGASVPVLAHWQYENRVVITSDGKSVNSSTQIQCGTQYAEALNEGARVTLPGDFRQYRVASVRTWPGEDSQLEVALV